MEKVLKYILLTFFCFVIVTVSGDAVYFETCPGPTGNWTCLNDLFSANCIFLNNHSAVEFALRQIPKTIKELNLTLCDQWESVYPYETPSIKLTELNRFKGLTKFLLVPPKCKGAPLYVAATDLIMDKNTFKNMNKLHHVQINIPLVSSDFRDAFSKLHSVVYLDFKWIKQMSKTNLTSALTVLTQNSPIKVLNISSFQTVGQNGYHSSFVWQDFFGRKKTGIEQLDLSWNGLAFITPGISAYVPNLKYLDISHNLLVHNDNSPFFLEVFLLPNITSVTSNFQGTKGINDPSAKATCGEFTPGTKPKVYYLAVLKCLDKVSEGNFSNFQTNHKAWVRFLSTCFSSQNYMYPDHLIPTFADMVDTDCLNGVKIPIFRYVKYIEFSDYYGDVNSHLGLTFGGRLCFMPNSNIEVVKIARSAEFLSALSFSHSLQRMKSVTGAENVQDVDISENYVQFDMSHYHDSFPALRKINISYNFISWHHNFSICSSMKYLEVLDMSHNNLTYISNRFIAECKILTKFILKQNFLTEVLFLELPERTNGMLLDLRQNEISFFNDQFIKELGKFKNSELQINFANNTIECSCSADSINFIKWFRVHYDLFLHWDTFDCIAFNSLKKLADAQLENRLNSYCGNRQIIDAIIYTTASISGLLIIVVSLVYAYKRRWKIRYFIFIKFPRVYRSFHPRSRADHHDTIFEYDAFVSYAAEDRFWVHGVLMKQLESMYNFNLCIHFRDFRIGADVVDEIVGKMEASREIIVVISETSVNKPYCDLELKIARNLALRRRKNLIIIKLGSIDMPVENSTAINILQLFSYLEWTDEMRTNEERQKLFWARLVNYMYNREIHCCGNCCQPFSNRTIGGYLRLED